MRYIRKASIYFYTKCRVNTVELLIIIVNNIPTKRLQKEIMSAARFVDLIS
jgi:hypothetical protein